MKKVLRVLGVLGLSVLLTACQQVEPDEPDQPTGPTHPFESTRIEHQYKGTTAFNGSYYDSRIYAFRNQESFEGGDIFRIWNVHNMDETSGVDLLEMFDDQYFENHILFCGLRDLAPTCELYLIGLDQEWTIDPEEPDRPFYKMKIDEVYPEDPGTIPYDKKLMTFFFIDYEIPSNSDYETEWSKYSTYQVVYWYWSVYLDEYQIPN